MLFRSLEILKYYKGMQKFELYAYCLMSNHIHMLMEELDDSISEAVKRIATSYVLWYNKKYDRTGHLFQGRFNSEVVENDIYFLTVIRYIHQNPLKAGIVNNILQYKWTSYNDYISGPNLIDTSMALGILSPKWVDAVDTFIRYMNEGNNDKCLDLEDRIITRDADVLAYLKTLGVENVSKLQQMDRNSRDEIIRHIKDKKLTSIRELSRITGVSKSIIQRA